MIQVLFFFVYWPTTKTTWIYFRFIFLDAVRCEWNKSWSSLPVCKPVSCSIPPPIFHAQPEHQSSLPSFQPLPISNVNSDQDFRDESLHFSGDTISIYHIVLPPMSISNQNHDVSQNQSPISLPNDDQPFIAKTEGFVFGDVVHYACDIGHRHNSSRPDSITCLANGQWSAPRPICESISCNPPPHM